MEQQVRERIRVYGIVQGVGFRPTVSRHAGSCGLAGTVSNKGPYVEIFLQGPQQRIDRFLTLLEKEPPKRAVILNVLRAPMAETEDYGNAFHIIESEKTAGEIFISPDIAICETCKKEMYDPRDKRYLHPFINCTCCGPRMTILDGLPYDRIRTSMKKFPMCPTCHEEYVSMHSRRYDAQPVCCNACGPRVHAWLRQEEAAADVSGTGRPVEIAGSGIVEVSGAHRLTAKAEAGAGKASGTCGPAEKTEEAAVANSGTYRLTEKTEDGAGKASGTCGPAEKTEEAAVEASGTGSPAAIAEERVGKAQVFHAAEEQNCERIRVGDILWKKQTEAPITLARRIIASGGIVGVKGIGGFHLCCDATNEAAVQLLRTRKHRPAKPFAVMMRDETVAERICRISDPQREILTGHQKPILLLPVRTEEKGAVAPSVAPGNPTLGVMLPYAPIHLLLFENRDGISMPDCLVMTSGNVSGAPICREDEDALEELGYLCDCILSHDRKIRIRADDTVMDFYENEPYMIRRSRGYAPLPIMETTETGGQVLAIGGELKNTFCLGINQLYYPSPYVGDLEDLRTVRALEETIGRFEHLLGAAPELIVCDLHPGYHSTEVAKELSEKKGIPLVQVQHHYAHVLSCMAENDFHGRALGIALDGTGYGPDGSIWGGELLLCTEDAFERVASIRPFLQVGGDASSREGWRIAVSMLRSIYGSSEEAAALSEKLGLCSAGVARFQCRMAENGINTVKSTSAGRLFDAVSAILGIRISSTFEGEASTMLEFAAEAWEAEHRKCQLLQERELQTEELTDEKETLLSGNGCRKGQMPEAGAGTADPGKESVDLTEDRLILPTEKIVRIMAEGRLAGEDTGRLAYDFHRMLAEQILEAAELLAERTGCRTAALSGGCYQNKLLLRLTEQGLKARGFEVLRHRMIPPNDGGIALGQAVYGMKKLPAADV